MLGFFVRLQPNEYESAVRKCYISQLIGIIWISQFLVTSLP